ncbi:hypothetical protein RMN57_35045 [Kitasatospora sp. CM 4170]|uniref:Uncharacterized protein n=1 Tax=Kitasatospora aburaviensis TaxID=67265 RepID=A0ABW1EV77_9ACTN|nr:hypothetical protein [Kitasatospora sp. CM 4170]WNM49547.1 hypothetical protein RMN57_35045 [Kitasatospora sp. CM 4170]
MPDTPGEPLSHAIVEQIHALAAQTSAAFADLLAEPDLTEAPPSVAGVR